MIDINKAKKELTNHAMEMEIDDPRTENKIGHMMRVAENCKKIAKSLNLSEEQIELAELIGVLHDIGRFEQYKWADKTKKFDHGEAGVEVLKKDNYIRTYIESNSYDKIIYTAIYEHNKYEISEGLSEEEKLFAKIIRDADKIDLLYEGAEIYWGTEERKQMVEEGELSNKMLEDFKQGKLADVRNKKRETDQILRFATFVFDVNFIKTLQIIKENNYVSRMIQRFNYKIPSTKIQMENVEKEINKFIEKKLES